MQQIRGCLVFLLLAISVVAACLPPSAAADIGITFGPVQGGIGVPDDCKLNDYLPRPAITTSLRSKDTLIHLAGTISQKTRIFHTDGTSMQLQWWFERRPHGASPSTAHVRFYRVTDGACQGYYIWPTRDGTTVAGTYPTICHVGCFLTISARRVKYVIDIIQP